MCHCGYLNGTDRIAALVRLLELRKGLSLVYVSTYNTTLLTSRLKRND
jgi:hypothetical protein